MRKRTKETNISKYTNDGLPVDPIDEDEQEEIVTSIDEAASAQMKETIQMLGIICLIAMVACLILGIVAATELVGRIHAALALGLHLAARHHSTLLRTSWKKEAVLAIASILPVTFLLLLPSSYVDELHFHWGHIFLNLLTSVAAIFVRRENELMAKDISDLHSSKYRYKSL